MDPDRYYILQKDNNPDADTSIFITDLQDANQKIS
jgi:hypothetical protein